MDSPKVTKRQLDILILLYRFRFLNRIQIQTLLNHKNKRRINEWLKDLNSRNIVGRHYSTKLKENTKPAVYYIAAKSRLILLGQPSVDEKIIKQRIYKEKEKSQRLINHCITLADFYLMLLNIKDYDKLHFFTKTDLSTYYYLSYNRPDAYIAKEKGGKTKRYFFEIIDEGTPRFILRPKIERCIEYFDSNKWQENTDHPFPTILMLCPNQDIKDFLHKEIAQKLEEEVNAEIDFYLSLKDPIVWINAIEDTETTSE